MLYILHILSRCESRTNDDSFLSLLMIDWLSLCTTIFRIVGNLPMVEMVTRLRINKLDFLYSYRAQTYVIIESDDRHIKRNWTFHSLPEIYFSFVFPQNIFILLWNFNMWIIKNILTIKWGHSFSVIIIITENFITKIFNIYLFQYDWNIPLKAVTIYVNYIYIIFINKIIKYI